MKTATTISVSVSCQPSAPPSWSHALRSSLGHQWVQHQAQHIQEDSSVIRLAVRPEPSVKVDDEKGFFNFVRSAFGQRRKTLINSVSSAGKWTKDGIRKALENAGLSETVRAEALTMEQLAEVFNGLE